MAPAKKSLFDTLIELNDKFHEYAADLITTAKIQEDVAEISMDLLNKVMAASGEGTAALATDPKLKDYYTQFNLWSQAPSNILVFYKPKPTDKTVTIPEDLFKDLLDPVLNKMANLIHDAAIDSIGPTKQLKNCKIANLQPDNAIAVGKYCSGAKSSVQVTVAPESKFKVGGKTFIQNYPQLLIQPLGVHKVMPSLYKSGDEIKMAVEYHDSYTGHTGSANRLRGTRERLELLGFDCNLGKTANAQYKQVKDIYCNIDDIAPNTIRELATFFSLLVNGDISSSIQQNDEMYPVIRDKAWEKAVEYNAKYGDNTWESPLPHQLNWDELAQEWKQEQQFTKNPLYNDLRQLLYLRDIHHMIEEKYHIDAGGADLQAMKQILENGKKAQAILAKNHWGNIQHNINNLQKMVNEGEAQNIAGISDGIGHEVHSIVYHQLTHAGQYAHCLMDDSVGNISAGNLAYCEGILTGSKGTPISSTGGNGWIHSMNPNTFKVSVGEDFYPDFEYALKVSTSGLSTFWTKEIQKALHQKFHFNCAGQLCTLPTESHDVIRQVAAFLSNLRGANEAIGEECAKKAVEDAYEASVNMKSKGVFTFAQNSIFNSSKEWVDKCFKQYGITPVGMSKEEEVILKLIGANKVYGGCSFENSEILPDIGVIKYCGGVRYNPQGKTNAFMNPSGTLEQYFHGTTDKIANIKVETEKPGQYSVTIGGLNMRDKQPGNPLQKAVVNRLKKIGLTCPTTESCTTKEPVSEKELRFLASYLSSFHQAYQLDTACVPKAEQFVFDTATKLSANPEAFKVITHPHYKAEWEKEVCAKGAKPPAPEVTGKETITPLAKKMLKVIKENPKIHGSVLFAELGKSFPGLETVSFVEAATYLDSSNQITASGIFTLGGTLYTAVKEEEKAVAIPPTVKYSYSLVSKLASEKHDAVGFSIGGCISQTKTSPTQAKAAYCAGIPQFAQVSGVDPVKIKGTIAKLLPDGTGYHKIDGINDPVIFDSSGKKLFVTLPKDLQHVLVKNYLVKALGYTEGKPWIFVRDVGGYLVAAFKAALFLSQLTYFDKLDEDCKVKAVEKAVKVAQTAQHNYIYPYNLEDWKTFCAPQVVPPEPAPKFQWHGPYHKFHTKAGTIISIPTNQIIELMQTGVDKKTLVNLLSLPNAWNKEEYESISKNEANEVYDFYFKEAQPPKVEGKLYEPSVTELTQFISNVFTNNPNQAYTIKDIEDLTKKVWSISTQKIFATIKSLQAEGLILKLDTAGAPSQYTMSKQAAKLKTFKNQNELNIFILGKFQEQPNAIFGLNNLKEVMTKAGYGIPHQEAINEALITLVVKEGKIIGVAPNLWTLGGEKKKPLFQFSGPELKEMIDAICTWKKNGASLGEVQGLFYKGFKTPTTGDTNTWIMFKYDECEKKPEEKAPLGLVQMKEFILNYLFQHHGEEYMAKDFPEINSKAGYQPSIGGMIKQALTELAAEKKIFFHYTDKGEAVYFWKPLETKEEMELDAKISVAIAEHMKENSKLQQEWGNKGQLWQNEAQEKDAYKKLPKLSQEIIHNLMDLYLLTSYKEHKPYDQVVKELQGDILKLYPKLTPLMVKLQLDLEKKVKINKGLLPECDETECQVKATSYETMSEAEKTAVQEDIKELIKSGKIWDKAADDTANKFGIKSDSYLEGVALGIAQLLAEGKLPVKKYEDWGKEDQAAIEDSAKKLFKGGAMNLNAVKENIKDIYGLEETLALNDMIISLPDEIAKEQKKLLHITNLTDKQITELQDYVSDKVNGGFNVGFIGDKILEHYPTMIKDKDFEQWVQEQVESELKGEEEKPDFKPMIKELFKKHPEMTDTDVFAYLVEENPEEAKSWMKSDVKDALLELSNEGFINYDEEHDYWTIVEGYKEVPTINELIENKPSVVSEIQDYVAGCAMTLTVNDCALKIEDKFGVKYNNDLINWIEEQVKGKPPSEEKHYEDLDLLIAIKVVDYIKELVAKGGVTGDEILESVEEEFGLEDSDGLSEAIYDLGNIEELSETTHTELQPWSDIGKIQQEKFAKQIVLHGVSGWSALKEAAKAFGIIPDEDELPSVLELKQMAGEAMEIGPYKEIIKSYLDEHGVTHQGELEEGLELETDDDKEILKKALASLMEEGIVEEDADGYYLAAKEETGNWVFEVSSEKYGIETYGPYDTYEEAEQGIVNVKEHAAELNDGVERHYTAPFKKAAEAEEEAIPTLFFDEKKNIVLDIINGAAYDFDWNLEYILDEWEDHTDAFKPDEEELKNILNALGDEDKITSPEEDVYHSKMGFKGEALAPISEIHYSDLTKNMKAQVDDALKAAKEAIPEGQEGTVDLSLIAEQYGITKDQSLYDAYNKIKKTVKLKEIHQLTASDFIPIDKDLIDLFSANVIPTMAAATIAMKYNLVTSKSLDQYVSDEYDKYQKSVKEQEKPEALIQEEGMASFIKQGMDAHAIQVLFAGGTYPQSKLMSTSVKLYKLYHPDQVVMTKPLGSMPNWIMSKLENLAQSMLSQGKTQEDTIWYIAYHFHLTKESVKPMVNSVAKLPVVEQKQLLETTIKILQVGEKLAGCEVGDEDLADVAASTVAYCQGVIHPMIITDGESLAKAITDKHGTEVDHSTWTQVTLLKTDIKHGGRTTLNYEPAIDEDNKNYYPEERSKELDRILQELGFQCEAGEKGKLDCNYALATDLNLSIADQDNIRRAAILISSIDKVAALPESCIPKAMEYAKNHAIGINKTSKPWTVPVYPETVDEWMKNVCEKVTV